MGRWFGSVFGNWTTKGASGQDMAPFVRMELGKLAEFMRLGGLKVHALTRELSDGTVIQVSGNLNGPVPIMTAEVRGVTEEGGVQVGLFLESGWLHILPGPVAGEIFYSEHLLNDYLARGTSDPYLDEMRLPGPTWIVREYSAWMDSEIYQAGHAEHAMVTGNQFAHSGKLAKLCRCVLGSKKNVTGWKAFLRYPRSTLLSHILYTDGAGDYWIVKITPTEISRARITWHQPGGRLLAEMKAESTSISRWSAGHKYLRNKEAYLFACARNLGPWERLAEISIEGTALWYGWNSDWGGGKAVHVTTEQVSAGATLDGIRGRLYEMTITDGAASVALVEDEVGTPSDTTAVVYYPDTFVLPQRMNALFWKSHLIAWTDPDQHDEFPVYAVYKSEQGEDDEYFEIWNEHETVPYDSEHQNYNDTKYNAQPLCGAGIKELLIYASGTNKHHRNGFYTKKAPRGNDKNFVRESQNQGLTYRITWNVQDGGTEVVCTASANGAFGSTRAYNGYNCTCGIWPPEPPGVCWTNGTYVNFGDSPICGLYHPSPVTFTIAYAQVSETTYPHLNSIAHSALIFNHNNPESVTLLRYYYDRQHLVTKRTKGYNCISHYHTDYLKPTDSDCVFDFGSFNGIWSYPGTHIRGWQFAWPDEENPPAYEDLQWVEDDTGHYYEGANYYEVEIEHVLITGKEVITVLKETYDDWDDTGDYQGVLTPLRTYPHYDEGIFCKAPIENYVASGNLINHVCITDTSIPQDRCGMFLMPIGRA